MIELIKAIAMLCALHTGQDLGGVSATVKEQTKCQAYYAKCIKAVGPNVIPSDLLKCMEEKK